MTSIVQNVCERYLKHIISVFCIEIDGTAVLKTHSLRKILRFIEENLPDFKINKNKVILSDGYSFSSRYPGDESFFANGEDVAICWEAVLETKRAVDHIWKTLKSETESLNHKKQGTHQTAEMHRP